MVGFDVPHITHDMILRFMGVNFSMILDGSARIPSSVGDDSKPIPELLNKIPTASPTDRKSTRLNSSHSGESRMPSSA